MRMRIAVPEEHVTPDVIDPALEAVTRLNEHLLATGQTPTSHELIARGARWRPEDPGDEHFDHGATIASRGWGDCDDWAPLHAATLRATGQDPGAVARVIPSGPNIFHAIVQKSDGSIDDPSEWAGMRPMRGRAAHAVHGAGMIDILACDPHDGRVYQGALAPAVGPLSLHCGVTHVVRGCHVIGVGDLFEARVDVPIEGSRLVHVHGARRKGVHVRDYWRRFPRVVGGAVPFALSSTCLASSPDEALYGAVVGAIYCGAAADMATPLDRYKLLAAQWAMQGMSPGQVRDQLIALLQHDLPQTGDPQSHASAMLAQLAHEGHIDGRIVVGGFFSALGHIASGIVHAVGKVVSKIGPWVGTIVHGLQAIVSLIPGIGTVVSDVLATAESAFDELSAIVGGNPIEGAIKAAYNYATSTVPGAAAIRFVLDPVVNTLLALAFKKEPVESAILNGVLSDVPNSPQIGPLTPRSVASTLAHLIVSHLGVKKTPPGAHPPKPAPLPPSAGGIVRGAPIVIHPDPRVHQAVLAKSHAVGRQTPHKLVVNFHGRRDVFTALKQPPHPAMPPRPSPPPKRVPLRLVRPHPHAPPTHPALVSKPMGLAHAAAPAHPASPPHPTAQQAPALAPAARGPGLPPGSSYWRCLPMPNNEWACSWQ